METTTIVLIVVIIVLLYILYAYYSDSATQLVKTASLLTQIPPIKDISKPNNTRFGHSVWIYVNTWDNNVDKTILSRDTQFRLYLDKHSPTLKLDVYMNDDTNETMMITNNFPLQKWVNIIISMDNQFVDSYLDGKLVRSQRFFKENTTTAGVVPAMPPGKEVALNLGNKDSNNFDAYASLLKRWTAPVDPKTAWDTYMKGNGSSRMASALSDIGIDVSILQNKEEIRKYSLM